MNSYNSLEAQSAFLALPNEDQDMLTQRHQEIANRVQTAVQYFCKAFPDTAQVSMGELSDAVIAWMSDDNYRE